MFVATAKVRFIRALIASLEWFLLFNLKSACTHLAIDQGLLHLVGPANDSPLAAFWHYMREAVARKRDFMQHVIAEAQATAKPDRPLTLWALRNARIAWRRQMQLHKLRKQLRFYEKLAADELVTRLQAKRRDRHYAQHLVLRRLLRPGVSVQDARDDNNRYWATVRQPGVDLHEELPSCDRCNLTDEVRFDF